MTFRESDTIEPGDSLCTFETRKLQIASEASESLTCSSFWEVRTRHVCVLS
jgi:hypothetical protein